MNPLEFVIYWLHPIDKITVALLLIGIVIFVTRYLIIEVID